jgi:hypothetical protein
VGKNGYSKGRAIQEGRLVPQFPLGHGQYSNGEQGWAVHYSIGGQFRAKEGGVPEGACWRQLSLGHDQYKAKVGSTAALGSVARCTAAKTESAGVGGAAHLREGPLAPTLAGV